MGPVAQVTDFAPSAIDRGEILIAGMAAMLICIFLGPKFIEAIRLREFGQQIREEGPDEHQTKAGTPTMGGLIVFVAIAVPYLVLSGTDTQSLAVFGVALACAALSACLVGASVGFLWFNAFPASVFMGDTGSLGLGGAIGALAVMTQTEVLLIVLGGIFVIEALSVAIQVASFKMFRRRVLLMAPVHHHFELMAWSETKIMLRFWIVDAVCAGIGYTLFQNSL